MKVIRVMSEIGQDLNRAQALLEAGELVGIPTETVYGLAGNGFDEQAVSRIFAAKERPKFDPLILHTDSIEKIEQWVGKLSPQARKLAERFWPGPLTLVVPGTSHIPDLVTSGLPSVAFRIPAHPLTHELLSRLDFPLAAPSANPFGYVSPTSPAHVVRQLGEKVPYILDGGTAGIGIESTIVALRSPDELRVLRLGGLSLEAIQEVVGRLEVQTHSSSNPAAPGMLKSHYAPRKKLYLGDPDELLSEHAGKSVALLLFQDRALPATAFRFKYVLSPSGDFTEAARNLFAFLRELDSLPVELILAERLPEQSLGRAINDRLSRASV